MIAGKYSENVRLAPEWKFNSPQLVQFLVYFTAKFFEFSFDPRFKIVWPQGNLDKV